MGYTKGDFVNKALSKIGYASFIYDAMPEQQQDVLQSLDAMMATWNAIGIRLGYALPSTPNGSSLNDETEVNDSSFETIFYNLAVRIAPDFGKTVSVETSRVAKASYDAMLVQLAQPLRENYPTTMPLGAGNKSWRWSQGPFVRKPIPPLRSGNDGDIDWS